MTRKWLDMSLNAASLAELSLYRLFTHDTHSFFTSCSTCLKACYSRGQSLAQNDNWWGTHFDNLGVSGYNPWKVKPPSLPSFAGSTSPKHSYEIVMGDHLNGEGGSTSGVTTLNKAPHDLLDAPFIRKVDHYPLRDIARLIVFLILHVPLAAILGGIRETFVVPEGGHLTAGSVLPPPKVIPRDGSLRAVIWMGWELISAFNPDLGKLPAHSAFRSISTALKGDLEPYTCGFNCSEAIVRFSCRPRQHLARGLRVQDLLVHLLAKPAEFDRDDRKWISPRHHADRIGALHPLAVH